MILLIDHYDSFAFNVYQALGSINPDIKVVRSDAITSDEIEALAPTHIVLSPGPGKPSEAVIYGQAIERFKGRIPILGICLGHQAIGEAFGATVTYAPKIMHGKASRITVDADSCLFKNIPKTCEVARYHSLVIDPRTMPDDLKVTARTEDGIVMAVEHRTYPVYGVQFHPESILTPQGMTMLNNFLA